MSDSFVKTPLDFLTAHIQEEGFSDIFDFLTEECSDSVVPGICTACGDTTDVEPDCENGYCDSCGSNQVQSPLVIMEVI